MIALDLMVNIPLDLKVISYSVIIGYNHSFFISFQM